MSDQTDLVIISCCSVKKKGGDSNHALTDEGSILRWLSPASRAKLRGARDELQRLSFTRRKSGARTPIELFDEPAGWMPALDRYAGYFFLKSRHRVIAESFKNAQHRVDIVIVSALYGLLAPWEPIRSYNLTMSDGATAEGHSIRVREWWKQHDLGSVLLDFVRSKHPNARVHNHLSSDDYSKSLSDVLSSRIPSRGTGTREYLENRREDVLSLLQNQSR